MRASFKFMFLFTFTLKLKEFGPDGKRKQDQRNYETLLLPSFLRPEFLVNKVGRMEMRMNGGVDVKLFSDISLNLHEPPEGEKRKEQKK